VTFSLNDWLLTDGLKRAATTMTNASNIIFRLVTTAPMSNDSTVITDQRGGTVTVRRRDGAGTVAEMSRPERDRANSAFRTVSNSGV